jgi:hypothetical protein
VTDDARSAATAAERIIASAPRSLDSTPPVPPGAASSRQASRCTRTEERGWPTGTDQARSAGDALASEPSSCTPRIAANAVLSARPDVGHLVVGRCGGRATVAEACAPENMYVA